MQKIEFFGQVGSLTEEAVHRGFRTCVAFASGRWSGRRFSLRLRMPIHISTSSAQALRHLPVEQQEALLPSMLVIVQQISI